MFPVDTQWALEWDEIEEDTEITRFLRENPNEWVSRRSLGQRHPPPRMSLPFGQYRPRGREGRG
jgi:hypothetical protein